MEFQEELKIFVSAPCQQLTSWQFWIGVAQALVGIFSFASLVAFLEWLHTTRQLKKNVTAYVKSVEFNWRDKTDEFVLMHRVRAFSRNASVAVAFSRDRGEPERGS